MPTAEIEAVDESWVSGVFCDPFLAICLYILAPVIGPVHYEQGRLWSLGLAK